MGHDEKMNSFLSDDSFSDENHDSEEHIDVTNEEHKLTSQVLFYCFPLKKYLKRAFLGKNPKQTETGISPKNPKKAFFLKTHKRAFPKRGFCFIPNK